MAKNMSCNSHIEKYQQGNRAVLREEYRELEYYKNDVDVNLSYKNYYETTYNDFCKEIDEAVKMSDEVKKYNKKRVEFCSNVMSCPESWGDKIAKEFFEHQQKSFENYLKKFGCEEKTHLVIHFDEYRIENGEQIRNLHATMDFCPLMKNKNGQKTLNARALLTREFYREYQSYMYESYLEFHEKYPWIEEMAPPEKGYKKHKTVEEYKNEMEKGRQQKRRRLEKNAKKAADDLEKKYSKIAVKKTITGKEFVSKSDYDNLLLQAKTLVKETQKAKDKQQEAEEKARKTSETYTAKLEDLRNEKSNLKSEIREMKTTDFGKTITENRQLKAENERLRDDLASARQQVRQYENVLEMAQISRSRGFER